MTQVCLHEFWRLLLPLGVVALVGAWALQAAPADEPAGAAVVAAIEASLVEAIAKAEKSVVAIARVRKDEASPDFVERLRLPQDGSGLGEASSTSPDFLPHEFGGGVVID